MQPTYDEKDIISLLDKVRVYNKEIGEYKMFTVTENFDYEVQLSNGKILFKKEELSENTGESKTGNIPLTARRFVKDKPQTKAAGPDFLKSIILTAALLAFGFCIVSGIIGLSKYESIIPEEPEIYDENVITDENVTTDEISESENPTDFLTIDEPYKYPENTTDDKFVVNVNFVNKAATETYHNAVIKVTYFTDDDNEISSECLSVNEVFPPNSTKNIELQLNEYDDVSYVYLELLRVKSR